MREYLESWGECSGESVLTGFKEEKVPEWSPQGGVGSDDLDYLWQKLTSGQRPNLCLL